MKTKRKLLSIILLTALCVAMLAGCASEPPSEAGKVTPSTPVEGMDAAGTPTPEAADPEAPSPETSTQTTFHVGDILTAEGLEIVYVASGEYVSDNQFLQPEEGNKYIYIELACKNTSDTDKNISSFDFECYADGYAADAYYGGNDALSATMSAGRTATGKVYFEVPKDAVEIEIEYTYDLFSDEKALFLYEGVQDSGYVPDEATAASEDAYGVGDVVDGSGLTIAYLSCEDYESGNQFIQPKEGCKYVSCSFEFENTSDSDKTVSSFSFKCYADGKACESAYLRDDDLSAVTLSPGRKASGTVTFEVPMDAATVEAEYETDAWTSEHIVFTIR